MHLKFGSFILYTLQVYRFTERKKRFHVQNCPCARTVCAKIGYVYGKVVVEFGRKLLHVDCLL